MKIRCSHCKELRSEHSIHDMNWTQAVCSTCLKGGHVNVRTCPQCGIAKPQKCAHAFNVLINTIKYQVVACNKCGQQRAYSVPVTGGAANSILATKKVSAETVTCAHCGREFHVPQDEPPPLAEDILAMCMKCAGEGHSMYGGCSKCAAEVAKEAEAAKAQIKATHFGPGPMEKTYKKLQEALAKQEALMEEAEKVKAAIMNDNPGNAKVVNQIQEYIKSFLTEGEKAALDPIPIATNQQEEPQWEGVVKAAGNAQVKLETVTCVHCHTSFEVKGDIKTWDLVYTTCIKCYQAGHRGLPRPLGHCDECPQMPNRGLIDPEELKKKPEEKSGRNIIL